MPDASSAATPRQLSLPEVSRTTGIAMPTILRLRRENPQKIPTTGSGSQQYFPEEILPVLEELFRAERAAERPTGLFSVPKVVTRPQRAEKSKTSRESRPAVAVASGLDEKKLSRRIAALEQRQRELGAEIGELLQSAPQVICRT